MKQFIIYVIDSFFLLTIFGLGVPAFCAIVLNQIEQGLFRVLSKRFGVQAVVYATGWLGTPIHELSHAILCPVFLHRIDEFQPFKPDFESGTMGYVKHTPADNPWSKLGGFFIGIAPLFGGSLALWFLTWACTGVNLLHFSGSAVAADGLQSPGATLFGFFDMALSTLGGLTQMRHWVLWPVFIYLSLCIGAHMAPSSADIKNGLPGLAMVLMLFALISFTVPTINRIGLSAVTMQQLFYCMNLITGPMVLLMMLAIVLNGANLLLMWLVCGLPGRVGL